MKTILTLLLVAVLAFPAMAKKPQPAPEPPTGEMPAAVILGALVLTCTVVAVAVIIKVNSTHPDDKKPVNVVLERSTDHATWEPVVTNRVVLDGRTPIQVFEDTKRDGWAFYRARVMQ